MIANRFFRVVLRFVIRHFFEKQKRVLNWASAIFPFFSTLDILMNAIYSLDHFTQNSLISLDAYGLRDLKRLVFLTRLFGV